MKKEKIEGTISIASKGYGFLSPTSKKKYKEDLFISKYRLNGALDKDLVVVKIFKQRGKKEAEVIKILKRDKKGLVCVMLDKNLALVKIPGEPQYANVKSKENLLKGDIIKAKIDKYGVLEEGKDFLVTYQKKIGNIKDPSTDSLVSIEQFSLEHNFSRNALYEAKHLKIEHFENRKDLTDLETITIDPTTAKDFDDALSISIKKDKFILGVHIADVSYFVKEGSSIDKEALQRGNSTYFPGEVVSMIPKELSAGICSLQENEVRLCVSVFMEFNKNGDLLKSDIFRSYIKSKKRFTYEEAFSVLKKEKESPFFNTLQTMEKLCYLLKKKRSNRGSIDFSLPDAAVEVDENKDPIRVNIVEYDISHQLVEEFMLKANETVAKELHKRKKPLIFRIHEPPKEKPFEDFYSFARILGFNLPKKPNKEDLQNLFLQAKETPFLHQLSIQFIRNMKIALYSQENLGHYGLSLEYYCHFTSPIRRYSDLIIHRLLFDEEKDADLKYIAKICSEKERTSFKAEKSCIFMKKARLIEKEFKKDPNKTYSAIITKIKPSFVSFEVEDLFFEGSIHVSDLGDDYFEYNPKKMSFESGGGGKNFKHGDIVDVKVDSIDLIYEKIDWKLI